MIARKNIIFIIFILYLFFVKHKIYEISDAFNHLNDLESKDNCLYMRVLFLLSLDSINRHVSAPLERLHCIALCICLGEAWVALPTRHPGFADCRQEWGPIVTSNTNMRIYVCVHARVLPRVRNISHADRNRLRCHYRASYIAKVDCWLSDAETLFRRFFHIIVLLSNEFKRIVARMCVRERMYMKSNKRVNLDISSFPFIVISFSSRRDGKCIVCVTNV